MPPSRGLPNLAVPSLALLGAIAAAPADGQAPLPCEQRFWHAWPEPAGPTGWLSLRPLLCTLDLDDRPDLVLLRGPDEFQPSTRRELILLPDVGREHACVPLGPAIDFVRLPGSTTSSPCQLLSLQLDGALTWHRCEGSQRLPTASRVALWPGTSRIWTVADDTTTEVFGLDAPGVRLRRATWTGSGLGPVTITTVAPGTSNVQAMDWDGDGVPEIVITAQGIVIVRRWNQAPVANLPTLPALQGAEPLVQVSHATGADLLVACASDANGTSVTWINATISGSLRLDGVAVSAIGAYDREGDGDDDIVLADAAHSRLHVLEREAISFTHRIVQLLTGPLVPDAGLAATAGGDIDGDGDGDLIALTRGTNAAHTFYDGFVQDLRPTFVRGDLEAASFAASVTVPVTVGLPPGLWTTLGAGASASLHFDGWQLDRTTGRLAPQRILTAVIPVARGAETITVPLPYEVHVASPSLFVAALQTSLSITDANGRLHSLPSRLLYLSRDPVYEQLLAIEAEIQGTGSIFTGSQDGGGDGGGDGNILGTKSARHEVGVPPF